MEDNVAKQREAFDEFLKEWLNESQDQVVILRHKVSGLQHGLSSDWDLGVRNLQVAGERIEEKFGTPLIKVERQFVVQRYYDWGQVDLLPEFEYHGWSHLSWDRVVRGMRVGEDGLKRPSLTHDAWIAWMTGVLMGARYADKYDLLLAEGFAADRDEMKSCAKEAFGEKWSEQLVSWLEESHPEKAAEHAPQLRKALMKQSFKRGPFKAAIRWMGHWFTEIKNHFWPPFPWIAVLGPDGSGKSTLIDALKEELGKRRMGVKTMHWRPHVTKKSREEGEEVAVVTDPHALEARGFLASCAKLGILFLDWWAGFLFQSRHFRATRGLWLSDRYYRDMQVDPRRYRYGGGQALANLVFSFLPKPRRTIILVGDAAVIHARKQEVEFVELERQIQEYRALGERLGDGAILVDAAQPLEQVVQETLEGVFQACREQYVP